MALPFWRGRSKISSTDYEDSATMAAADARRVMARPREFDETTVLEAAMNCFWAHGFEQSSVRDLAEGMGITGASLYNAFGDKRSLYRQAFVHYLAQTVRDRVARLESLPPASRSSSGRSTTNSAAAACWSMRHWNLRLTTPNFKNSSSRRWFSSRPFSPLRRGRAKGRLDHQDPFRR
jgi:AcrR family transcriptional regulator